MTALNKVGRQIERTEFRRDSRLFFAWREVRFKLGSGCHQRRREARCPDLCARFRSEPPLHTEELLLGVRFDNIL